MLCEGVMANDLHPRTAPGSMATPRTYSEEEISAILKRAAELQHARGPIDSSGLSLTELEHVAAEAGIDPAYVKTAALELDERSPDKPFHWLGAATTVDLERIVEGELTEATWEEAVGEIRRVFGAAGETGQTGRTREWTRRDSVGGRVSVTLSPQGKQTLIRISCRMTEWLSVLHVPLWSVAIAPIVLVYVFLSLGPLVETGIALTILAAFHLVASLAFGIIVRGKERKARTLLARLGGLLSSPEPVTPEEGVREALPDHTPERSPSEAARIDPDLLSDLGTTEPGTPTRRPDRAGERDRPAT